MKLQRNSLLCLYFQAPWDNCYILWASFSVERQNLNQVLYVCFTVSMCSCIRRSQVYKGSFSMTHKMLFRHAVAVDWNTDFSKGFTLLLRKSYSYTKRKELTISNNLLTISNRRGMENEQKRLNHWETLHADERKNKMCVWKGSSQRNIMVKSWTGKWCF